MDTRGNFLEWRFSPLETASAAFSLAAVCVGITLWSVTTFQSKHDATEVRFQLEKRMDGLETQLNKRMDLSDLQISTVRMSVEAVAKDTSWIRGRLEPKSN